MSEKGGLVFADWCQDVQRSVLRQMISVVAQPGVVSFAGGLPAPELFPVDGYKQAMVKALESDPLALQYRPPYPPLKAHVVDLLKRRGVETTVDNIFFTTGAQQGLDVLSRMFLNQGGEVILEESVYSGVQQSVQPLQPKILPVGTCLETGMDVDAVEQYLKDGHKPAFIYTIPNSHNPLGVSMSMEKRRKLAQLARTYHVPILEDDPYGLLMYDEHVETTTLYSMAPEWVFYMGSFSKILAPALRLGWMLAPSNLMDKLAVVKEACDLECSGLTQRAVSHYLDSGSFQPHLTALLTEYTRRRDAMLATLDAHFPKEAKWTKPVGGMFVWVELPRGMDTAVLFEKVIAEEKVAFIPGFAFALPGLREKYSSCLRLNFSNSSVEVIQDGIARLGKVLKREIATLE